MRTWLNAAVVLGVAGLVAGFAARRGASAVVEEGDRTAAALASLEADAARKPHDVPAAVSLARAYLDRGAPGLAVTVFERTPEAATSSSGAADLAARAYFGAGHATESLALTKIALAHCEETTCDATFLAHAIRRENLLEAMVEMGIEDADKNPSAVDLAYRRSVRQVRIAMN